MTDSRQPAVRPPLCGVRRVGDNLLFFGEIDQSNADDLAARAVAGIQTGIVCLNLSQVRFFSAAGIRMMVAAHTAATSVTGGLRVVCSAEVMRILQLCRLTGVDGLRLTPAPEARNGKDRAAEANPNGVLPPTH